MGNLTEIQSSQSVKLAGAGPSTGVETYYAQVDSFGSLQNKLKDGNGADLGTIDNPVYVNSNSLSPFAGFTARKNAVIAANAQNYSTYTMTADVAISDFHFGGRGIGQGTLLRVDPAAVEFVPGGGFNSTADVTTTWVNANTGGNAAIAWTYTTLQSTEGTGSATNTFVKSDGNHLVQIKYNYSTPKDVTQWQYIRADVRVTVAAGGNTTRTVSIVLTDTGGNTRFYSIAGTTNSAPFSTEQWQTITGDIGNPTSETGTFDPYNVASVTLRLQDGNNKTGTIYWDNVKFYESTTLIERIYTLANTTFQLMLTPSEVFNTGEVLGLRFRNNDTSSKEFTIVAKGVEI